jgi:hypothetical protein
MNIMNRARKLAVMDDEERSQTSFRMEHYMHPFYSAIFSKLPFRSIRKDV